MRDITLQRTFLSTNKSVHLSYLLLCLGALGLSAVMSTNGVHNSLHLFGLYIPLNAPCLFKLLAGHRCLVCGMTRAFIYMSHLNPAAALRMNPRGCMVYLLCLFEVSYRALLLIKEDIPFLRFFGVFEKILALITCMVTLVFFVIQFV